MARVIALHEARMLVEIPQAGRYRISIRYTPYWHTSSGCLGKGRDGLLSLTAVRPGIVSLSFTVDPKLAFDALMGETPPACDARSGATRPTGPPSETNVNRQQTAEVPTS